MPVYFEHVLQGVRPAVVEEPRALAGDAPTAAAIQTLAARVIYHERLGGPYPVN